MQIRFSIIIDPETGEPDVETYFWDEYRKPPPLIKPRVKKKEGEEEEKETS